MLQFRHEMSLATLEKEKADGLRRKESLIGRGASAKLERVVEMKFEKEKQDEQADIYDFRHAIALHKAEKLKEDEEKKRESLEGRGEIAREHQQISSDLAEIEKKEREDILNFRHETAVAKAEKTRIDKETKRESLQGRGEVAREQQQIEVALKKINDDNHKDILNFRHETALAQAAKMKADKNDRRNSLSHRISAWTTQRKTDENIHKQQKSDLEVITFSK